jgi:CRISPR system Cascade subunit CasB
VTKSTSPPSEAPPKWAPLYTTGAAVDRRISALQRSALANRANGVAALARLRRAVGKPPGAVQDILEYTLDADLAGPGAGDDPTADETAAHIAMTLYALHQQSQRAPMHRRGYGLGRSVRQLNGSDVSGEPTPVRRRFNTLGTADSLDELVHHARGMIQLLRAKAIPLDYGLLADQLVRWQSVPAGPSRVRLTWGRDFYRTATPSDDRSPEPAEGSN